jgi:hypothetical protein
MNNTRNTKLEGSCTYEFMEMKHGQIFCKFNSGRHDTLKYAWQRPRQDSWLGGGGHERLREFKHDYI